LRRTLDKSDGGVHAADKVDAESGATLLIPIVGGGDIGFRAGGKMQFMAHRDRRRLLAVENPGFHLGPRRTLARIGLIVGEALVKFADMPLGQRERVGLGGDFGPEFLDQLQFRSQGRLAQIRNVGDFHREKVSGNDRGVKPLLQRDDFRLQPFAVAEERAGSELSDV